MTAATLTNWREAKINSESFRNIDKILKTDAVDNDHDGHTPKLEDATSQAFAGFKLNLGSGPELDLASYEAHTQVDGLVVLHQGKVVHQSYHNGNDASSRHILMSMTKSVAGFVAGILSSRGVLDLNAPVHKYVPEASSVFDKVTVQQCLDMTSGLKYDDNTPAYRAAAGWSPLEDSMPAKNLWDFLSTVGGPNVAPGSEWNYSSVNTDLIGWVLERASGKKLADLISELIWKPMGAQSDAFITVDAEGHPRAAGGFCASVLDVARFGQLIVDGGSDIVPLAWLDTMLRDSDQEIFARGTWAPAFKDHFKSMAYKSCWLIDEASETYCALGVYGQQLMVDRKNGIVLAKTASQPDPVDFSKVVVTVGAFKEFQRILLA